MGRPSRLPEFYGRATPPKALLRIAPKLFACAALRPVASDMDKEVLNNGTSYFLGPLLNWTLVGVIRLLLTEIQRKAFA